MSLGWDRNERIKKLKQLKCELGKWITETKNAKSNKFGKDKTIQECKNKDYETLTNGRNNKKFGLIKRQVARIVAKISQT